MASGAKYDQLWHWRARLAERKGTPCRVLARGALNSVLVEFMDGHRVITSRYAIRLRRRGEAPVTPEQRRVLARERRARR